jgi:hypothetical protein
VAHQMQQTRQSSHPTQQPYTMDMDPPNHREERHDAPIAPRADRERAREREQRRRSPRNRVDEPTLPIRESRSTQARNMYASRTERTATRAPDAQENDSRRISPYVASHGRDMLADNTSVDPVLLNTYHSTPPSGPSGNRGRGMSNTTRLPSQ